MQRVRYSRVGVAVLMKMMARGRASSALLLLLPSRPAALLAPALTHAGYSAAGRRRGTQLFCSLQQRPTPVGGEVAADVAALRSAKSAEPGGRKYMIDKQNDVSRLLCPTPQILDQGLLETQHLPHICIAGESNAGKSSLINHLLKKHSLAKASSVAGKTRSVDLMLVNERLVLTDLPGLPSRDHQVSAIWERSWRPLVFQYIRKCEQLRAMIYVHDVRWKVTNYMREFLEEVESHGLPVLLVLAKDDRILTELRPSDTATPEAAREAEIAMRERLMTRTRRGLDFSGVHLHYSVDSDRPASRKARRRLLRYMETIVATSSREEAKAVLEEIAADKFARLDAEAS